MIEQILYDYLGTQLSPVPVYTERQASSPKKFVLIDHTGGGKENHLRRATVALQTYGASLLEAATLAETVVGLMTSDDGILSVPAVASVSLAGGPYNYSRSDTKEYRYQAVFSITYY